MTKYDLFLSYSTADRAAVEEIRTHLEALGVSTFLDRTNLPAGQPWPQELEQALLSCKGVAVFVGNRPELGKWQLRESWMALDLQAKAKEHSFPVGRWCADSARWASSGRHVDHRDRRRVMISM